MKKVLFIKNTVILTVTAFLLRSAGIVFRIWLTGMIGAEGIGLYQIVFSVYLLASTFATTGISTAVTRITTRCLANQDAKGCRRVLKISLQLCFVLSLLTAGILWGFRHFIALHFLHDEKAVAALWVLPLSLPFLSISAGIRGYFTARRQSLPTCSGQIFEQLLRFVATYFLVTGCISKGIAVTTAAVLLGDTVAEAGFALYIWLCYLHDRKKLPQTGTALSKNAAFRELWRISAPISAGRYLHTALRTLENILTPACLALFTENHSSALAQFGLVKGMALPILMFPASLLTAVSTLLVPEITEATEHKNKKAVSHAVEKVFSVTLVSALPIAAVFFCCSREIGEFIYCSREVGSVLKMLAPLVPFMYVDLVTDGILKGLDQQKILLRNSVLDSALRILLICILIPKMGLNGYFAVMVFSNLLTPVLSVFRIVKITGISLQLKQTLIFPLTFALAGAVAAKAALLFFKQSEIWRTVLGCAVVFAVYLLWLYLFGYFKNLKRRVPC